MKRPDFDNLKNCGRVTLSDWFVSRKGSPKVDVYYDDKTKIGYQVLLPEYGNKYRIANGEFSQYGEWIELN